MPLFHFLCTKLQFSPSVDTLSSLLSLLCKFNFWATTAQNNFIRNLDSHHSLMFSVLSLFAGEEDDVPTGGNDVQPIR